MPTVWRFAKRSMLDDDDDECDIYILQTAEFLYHKFCLCFLLVDSEVLGKLQAI